MAVPFAIGAVLLFSVPTGIKVPFKNKYWILITGTLILIFIAMTINGGAAVYYAQTILNNKDLV